MRFDSSSAVSRADGEKDEVVTNKTFRCLELVEAAEEVANGGRADVIVRPIALRLHVDAIQAERVLVDDAINPAIARPTDERAIEVIDGAPVTHGDQEAHDKAFEERGRSCRHALEQFAGKRRLKLTGSSAHDLVGCQARDRCTGRLWCRRRFDNVLWRFPEPLELGEALEVANVDPLGSLGQASRPRSVIRKWARRVRSTSPALPR